MENAEVTSSPASDVLASETPRPISPNAKWYMTDIGIELTSENVDHDHCNSAVINVKVLDPEIPGPKDALNFEKISGRVWKYDGTIALTRDITLFAGCEGAENLGSVHLTKSELEKSNKCAGSSSQPLEVMREFQTEGDRLQLRLIFVAQVIPPDMSMEQLGGRYPTYEALAQALSEDPDIVLAWMLESPDKISSKRKLLNFAGTTFRNRFIETGAHCDIDNCVLAYKMSVQLLPVVDATSGIYLRDYGVSVLTRYKLMGSLTDLNEAVSSLRKAVQFAAEGHYDLPGFLHNLGISLQARFKLTGDFADIAEAISSQQKSIQLAPEGHAETPAWLNGLGTSLQARFEHSGDLSDITEAIISQRKSVQLTPEGHAGLPIRLSYLGNSLGTRFGRTGNLVDISEAIQSQRMSVQLTPENHIDLPSHLNNLGFSLKTRFERTGDLADISEAISALHRSVQLTPEGSADLLTRLHNLGFSLQTRFVRTGDLADISEAIASQRKCVQLALEGHPELPSHLSSLGSSHGTRFLRTGDLADISEAIIFQRRSIQLTPEGHAGLPTRLNNLGFSLQTRFERTGDMGDISESIACQRKSVQLTPEGNGGLPTRLCNLGFSLQTRFNRTGDLTDISEAIIFHRKSVQLTPEGHAELPVRLSSLGNSLGTQFGRTGDLAGISEAISSHRIAVQLTPDDHAELPARLNNLGVSLQARFGRTGDLADISEAIISLQKSIHLTPGGHAGLPTRLKNLGFSLQTRFDRTGDLADISEAIMSHRQSVQLTPEGHAGLPTYLSNLGSSLGTRFLRTSDLTDISEAISSQRIAVQLTPEDRAERPGYLNNLGTSLRARFKRTDDLDDIAEAITYQQKSIRLIPEGHAGLPALLNNLGRSFQASFERTKDPADISEGISSQLKSIQLTPDGHAGLPGRLINIGDSFAVRFEHTKKAEDVQRAVFHYRLAATSVSGPPPARFAAAEKWAYWARQRTDKSQISEAYKTGIRLISQVAGLDQTIQNRYANLIDISDLSASAAAAAIDAEQYNLALEWLEQGRCLVWSQLNDLRAPIDELCEGYPELADEIVRVSRALENAGSRAEPTAFTPETSMMMKMSIEDEAHTHIKLAQEWDRLLVQVRAIPQFNDFLRPPSYSALLQSIPDSGYVVAINIHQSRSDALVLVTGAKEPLHIVLPDFPYEKANSLRHDLKALLHDSGIRMRQFEQLEDITRGSRRHVRGVANILRQLWISVVKPILDGLGYSTPASKLPRIWWCVTGPLAFLPIHAAGIYAHTEATPGIYTALSDFAVSSYTPTVRSLVERNQSSQTREVNAEKIGLLMISQPDTPKLARIPGTTIEVKAIKRLLDNHKVQHLCLESREATVDRVKTSMDAHTCIHFACHASQNTTKPLQSGFYLYDGRLELASIIREHLAGADLAFLSACQTSTGDEKLSEEAVHLAGGMLAAGYRGVVATMWSIKDNYGPKLAEEFYKNLLNHATAEKDESSRFGSDNAARALHYATQQLRTTLDNSESSLLTWVPFVHFGL